MRPVLELEGVGRRYGELQAVDDVTLAVELGSRHALIGPNGAGKSTLFHLVSGTVRPTSGTIRFAGHDVTRMAQHRRTRLGLGRTFQHSRLFDGMIARENVAVAAQRQYGHARNLVVPTSRFVDVEARADELLSLVGLADICGRTRQARCRMAIDVSSRSPSRWRRSRACCCSTSRRRACPATRRSGS